MQDIKLIILIGVGLVLYFFPTIVAKRRKHRNFDLVLVINAFVGWTIVGWVVALAIGVYKPRERGVYVTGFRNYDKSRLGVRKNKVIYEVNGSTDR